ncbi:MAG: hypothetical protein ABR886_12020, partial [Dehalococcoidales bacterium]
MPKSPDTGIVAVVGAAGVFGASLTSRSTEQLSLAPSTAMMYTTSPSETFILTDVVSVVMKASGDIPPATRLSFFS